VTRALVYRNLTRACWSIAAPKSARTRGPVTGYADAVALRGVTFVVLENRRLAVVAAGRVKPKREVHAWCAGELADPADARGEGVPLTYCPYVCGAFVRRDTGAPIARADFVVFTADRGAVAYGAVS